MQGVGLPDRIVVIVSGHAVQNPIEGLGKSSVEDDAILI